MVTTFKNSARCWLWAICIGGFICGVPSMFFLFFHPLMIPFGFVLGICLGGLWVVLARFLFKNSLLNKWNFGVIGIVVGVVGTIVWGVISGIYLKWFEGWAPFFIGIAFLTLTITGFFGSIIGRRQMTKIKELPVRNDVVLAFVLSFDILFFVFIPMLNLR